MPDLALLMMQPGRDRDRVAGRLGQQKVVSRVVDSFLDGLELLLTDRPDVAVVDLGLEDIRDHEDCALLCQRAGARVIALSDDAGRPPAAELLGEGVDDYLTRPFSALELVARVRALIRRVKEYSAVTRACLQCGEIVIDTHRREVVVAGRPVELTPKEFDLLIALAARPGELLRREELLQEVWGYGEGVTTRTLDVHIGRLRRKIDDQNTPTSRIITVPRVGYRLAA